MMNGGTSIISPLSYVESPKLPQDIRIYLDLTMRSSFVLSAALAAFASASPIKRQAEACPSSRITTTGKL
jgi:hypothetical protein